MIRLQSEWRWGKGRAPDIDLRVGKADRDLPRICPILGIRRMHMNTRGAAIATNDNRLRKVPRPDGRRLAPQARGILVSERTARADVFAISIVPTDSDITVTRYSAPIERVQELARARRVDGWYTCDHTEYARVASSRSS
jgi:hypothetical protein